MKYALVSILLGACGTDVQMAQPDSNSPVPDAFDPGPDELPCDVKAALAASCTVSCHTSPPNSNAPQALTNRLDFYKPAISVDGMTVAQVAVARLGANTPSPMPPATEPPASASDLATLRAWLAAGTPAGTCGAIDPKPAPLTCASAMFWTMGETGSELMQPGKACRTCHGVEATEVDYFFQGTVFPAFHEQDLCNSPPPTDAKIEILDDATSAITLTLTPDAVGNFESIMTAPGVALPYRARVTANGLSREMTTSQTSGDCNACHTEQGTHVLPEMIDAPGRIVWPTVAR